MEFKQWKSENAFQPCFNRILKNKLMKQVWTKMMVPLTWGNHCNQTNPLTVDEKTSAPLHRKLGSFLMSKLLQMSQVWKVPFPDGMFQLLPKTLDRI